MTKLATSTKLLEKSRFHSDRVPLRVAWPPPWLAGVEPAEPERNANQGEAPQSGELPERPVPEPLPLFRILPPLPWLTSKQRRLWQDRTAAYRANGMSESDAQQEAMAELIFTGKLCNPEHPLAQVRLGANRNTDRGNPKGK
jgi:hypothetical protein